MSDGTPIGEPRRRFRLRRVLAICLLGLPILLLALINLTLASPWSCRWIEGKIQQRVGGLDSQVASATWTPWDGIAIYGIKISQPEPLRPLLTSPLLQIKSFRAKPIWRAWVKGRAEVTNIVVDSPKVMVPIELLSHLTTTPPPQTSQSPVGPNPQPQSPQPQNSQPQAPAAAPMPSRPPVIPPPSPPVFVQQAATSQPTAWLQVNHASLTVVFAARKKTLLEISELTTRLPIAGAPAKSILTIDNVAVMDQISISKITGQLDWTSPILTLLPLNLSTGSHKLALTAKIAALGGFPLQLEAAIPQQALAEMDVPFKGKASATSIVAEAKFHGLMLSPATWQGSLVAESIAPKLRLGERELLFDRSSSVTVMRGGMISCVDARLTSDEHSLLGNATLLADGRCAAALRWVTAPENTGNALKLVFPSFEGSPNLTSLSTPQRAAFDLEAHGNLRQIFLRLGKGGPVVELNP